MEWIKTLLLRWWSWWSYRIGVWNIQDKMVSFSVHTNTPCFYPSIFPVFLVWGLPFSMMMIIKSNDDDDDDTILLACLNLAYSIRLWPSSSLSSCVEYRVGVVIIIIKIINQTKGEPTTLKQKMKYNKITRKLIRNFFLVENRKHIFSSPLAKWIFNSIIMIIIMIWE